MFGTKKQKRRKNYSAKVNHTSGQSLVKTFVHNSRAKYQREQRQEKRKLNPLSAQSTGNDASNMAKVAVAILEYRMAETSASEDINELIWESLGWMDKKYLDQYLDEKESLKFYQTIADEVREKHKVVSHTRLDKLQNKYLNIVLDGRKIENLFTEDSMSLLDSWSQGKTLDNDRFKYLHLNICLWRSKQDGDLRKVPKKEDCFLSDMWDFTSNPSIKSYNIMVDSMREYSLTIKYTLVLSSLEDV